jgi:hypothetical protein
MARLFRDKRSQRGEAEMLLFGIVVLLCAIVSGSLMVLNWVKDSKNAKVQEHLSARFKRGTPAPVLVVRDPAAYYAHCQKSAASLMNATVKCEVMDESYGELYVMPFE